MPLNLKIENETTLPDGGPLGITVSGRRNIDIGRDTHLDWTLPDPTRFISSKHAEIRYKDNGYWLHDVSTNGTFLNGGDHRMQAPHRLRDGDRFTIGHYIIAVALDADQPDAAAPPPIPAYQEIWATNHEVAPPIDRATLKPPRERAAPVNPDFLDWVADVPTPFNAPEAPIATPFAASPSQDDNWAKGPPSQVPITPTPPPDIPGPRRPVWASEPQAPWAAEASVPSKGEGRGSVPMPEPAPAPPVEGLMPERRPAHAAPSIRGSQPGMPDDFVRRLAQAAGLSEAVFAGKDAGELADQLGTVMRLVAENVMQLLKARVQAKRLTRSSQHTMIQALDNNPLKFSPTSEEALRIMFGPPTQNYLDARRALEQSFEDLKTHQIKTYSAMQHALTALMAQLEPEKIEQVTDAGRGIASLVASRKAKLWDAYVARWQAQFRREGAGLVDAFMVLFADYYDRDDT